VHSAVKREREGRKKEGEKEKKEKKQWVTLKERDRNYTAEQVRNPRP